MVDDNVIKRDGQTWNKDCNTCSCNNGKVICEPKSCDCNAIRGLNYADISTSNEDKEDFNVKCCSHCFSGEEGNKSCTDSEDQVKHQDGDRWIHECQQCECKVCIIRTVIKKNLAKFYTINSIDYILFTDDITERRVRLLAHTMPTYLLYTPHPLARELLSDLC